MNRYCKLIMVTPKNNNKFYEMTEKDGRIEVKYGRIESSSRTISKSLSDWDSIRRSKISKGYIDITDMVSKAELNSSSEIDSYDLSLIDIKNVRDFISKMISYRNKIVSKTYSVKAQNVTKKQVDSAQNSINKLVKLDPNKTKSTVINKLLIQLYTIIPRRMGNTKQHLLPNVTNYFKLLESEQDNLDAMASKVKAIQDKKDAINDGNKKYDNKFDILSELNSTFTKVDDDQLTSNHPDLGYLIEQIPDKNRISSVLKIENDVENKRFDEWMSNAKNKETRYLIHGTRCSSVLPIIQNGLQIRPSGNFSFSGKAYGEGNYFSEVWRKSLGYTGYDQDIAMLIYEVHTGNPYVYDGWYRGNNFTLNYKNLSERGYDSTYVKAGKGLLNSEIISYHEHQCRIKYVFWLKR